MAKKLYFSVSSVSGRTAAETTLGTNNTTVATGSGSGWMPLRLMESAGTTAESRSRTTVAGPTSGLEIGNDAAMTTPLEWISEPLSADFTVSGTMTFNLWGLEAAMTTNAGLQVIVEKIDAAAGTLATVINSEAGSELGTSNSVNNWTGTPTSTSFKRGDRIRARVLINDAGGTMSSASSATFRMGGPTGGADGDSWIQFNENLTFETSDPAGSTLYLTTTSAGINPGSANEYEAWTSRGSGTTDAVVNTAAGWTSPIQFTETAGGTALEWYTKQLQAFTLGGKALANIRLKESAASDATGRVEIAVCASDGTGATVWGVANMKPASDTVSTEYFGDINSTSDRAFSVYVAGDDTAVTDGQRLRIRVFIDDVANDPMNASQTVTLSYAGTSGGASGDTYVILPQSVTEYSVTPLSPPFRPQTRPTIYQL